MIILITGTPGSGKTLFAVNKILQLKKEYPHRNIYADIDKLQVDDILPSPEDWRTTEENSILFYDEAQQHERFRSGYGNFKDDILQGLQVARHTGYDIYFITQSPRFLNAWVLDLVGEHYHLHRPFGAKLASVYYWRGCRKQPHSLASQELAENRFLFTYPKNLFDYYKSATSHSVKFKLPTKIYALFAIILIIFILVYKFYNTTDTQKFISPKKLDTMVSPLTKPLNVNSSSVLVNKKNDDKVDNFKYDYQKPLDTDYSTQKYQPVDIPKFSGAVVMGKKCVAYTQQATIARVSHSDCLRIAKGEIPFNPFKQLNIVNNEVKSVPNDDKLVTKDVNVSPAFVKI